jgi:hypothetical protein
MFDQLSSIAINKDSYCMTYILFFIVEWLKCYSLLLELFSYFIYSFDFHFLKVIKSNFTSILFDQFFYCHKTPIQWCAWLTWTLILMCWILLTIFTLILMCLILRLTNFITIFLLTIFTLILIVLNFTIDHVLLTNFITIFIDWYIELNVSFWREMSCLEWYWIDWYSWL